MEVSLMRKVHSPTKFTLEQMKLLAENPFTHRVTETYISYTLEFKNIFLARYEAGEMVKDIFVSLGYDPAILGNDRMYCFARRISIKAEAGQMPTEESPRIKLEKPTNVDYNTMPAQQSVAAMQREIAYLRQQVEFLKKITELDKGRK